MTKFHRCSLESGRLFSYDEITRIASEQISHHVQAARRRATSGESSDRKERAYGAYLGWRALVESYPDRTRFESDDRTLEALLTTAANALSH